MNANGSVSTPSEWYLYIIRCADGSLYTGISTDVARRLAQHRAEIAGGAKYLRGRAPLELVLQKRLGDRSMASKVESRLKKLSKCDKEELLRTGTGLDDFMDGILH